MEQETSATPSPRSKENNPLESSKFTSKGKATTAIDHRHGVTHETSSPVRQSRASASSHGKQIFGHSIKSLLPHSTRSTLGKKSKDDLRSPLPLAFQGQPTSTTSTLASLSEDQLGKAHVFHSRQAMAHLEELVRRKNSAPPPWIPPNDWIVSKKPEEPPSTAAEQPRLRGVGSLASVDEEIPLVDFPHESRKDSAFTQGVRRSVASAGRGQYSKVEHSGHPTRSVIIQITLD
jgi:hypothetical protein